MKHRNNSFTKEECRSRISRCSISKTPYVNLISRKDQTLRDLNELLEEKKQREMFSRLGVDTYADICGNLTGFPGSSWLENVPPGWNIPVNAIFVSALITSLLSLINLGTCCFCVFLNPLKVKGILGIVNLGLWIFSRALKNENGFHFLLRAEGLRLLHALNETRD